MNEYMNSHPYLFAMLVVVCGAFASAVIMALVNMPFRMWNRLMRSRNIKAQGWPPPYCDADGDFKEEKK